MLKVLQEKQSNIAVIGLGYVGLPIALEFAKKFRVIGFDINENRIQDMRNNIDPSNELIAENFENCDIYFTSNIEDLKTALQARVFKNLRDVTVNEDQYQFVSINLEKIIAATSASKYDVQLQEGDILYIPTFNETVSVSGDVLYPVAVKYEEGATLKDYINQAGGFNNTALKSKSYVV